MFRRVLAVVPLLLLLIGSAAESAPGGPVEIRLGHGFAAEEQLWLMAARPDIAPNQGKAYTLKLVAFRASADRLTAYEAGQLDGGTISGPTSLFAAEQGLPLKLVASVSREVPGGNWHNTTYLALADSGIRSPRDLRGKTIGIVDFKSATDLWARTAVASGGLDPNRDVQYVVVPFPAMGEALRARRIDVGTFPNPFYTVERSRGGVVEVFTSKTGVPFDEELILLFFRPEFVQRNEAAVRAFLRDFVAATRWYLSNPREARQALIDRRFVLTPAAIYLDMQDYYREPTARITVEALRRVQELHLKVGWQSRALDLRKLVDNSLLPY
ncbi:MAG: ABC transporter substrate-binding protein [Armatimonadota bacterium]|nr:ABC transporter substrate-binding protein [Armatimonadota bacterium]